MLLQQILQTLDAELERLHSIREIVSDLATTPGTLSSLKLPIEAEVEPMSTQQEEPLEEKAAKSEPKRVRNVRAVESKRRLKKGATEEHALGKAIPAKPVVVSRAAVEAERDARKKTRTTTARSEPKPPKGSLGAMIQAMRLNTAL